MATKQMSDEQSKMTIANLTTRLQEAEAMVARLREQRDSLTAHLEDRHQVNRAANAIAEHLAERDRIHGDNSYGSGIGGKTKRLLDDWQDAVIRRDTRR